MKVKIDLKVRISLLMEIDLQGQNQIKKVLIDLMGQYKPVRVNIDLKGQKNHVKVNI